jgi:hypothetical protein
MPMEHLLDKLIGCVRYVPFKCRACRAKFYRRPQPAQTSAPPAVKGSPEGMVAVCPKDPANTLRRLDDIIRIAENSRSRRV